MALFVHGVLLNGYLWRHQLADLSDIRRCIAVDLLAHGDTEIEPGQDVSVTANANMLREVLDALQIDKVDVVSGYRVWQSSRPRRPLRRFAYRTLLRLLFGLRLIDVDCPFKLFRRSVFARIPIQSNGPFAHAEILAKANFLGCIMTEVPVRYEPGNRGAGTHPFPATWRREAFRVFFHPDFGPPFLPEEAPPPQL